LLRDQCPHIRTLQAPTQEELTRRMRVDVFQEIQTTSEWRSVIGLVDAVLNHPVFRDYDYPRSRFFAAGNQSINHNVGGNLNHNANGVVNVNGIDSGGANANVLGNGIDSGGGPRGPGRARRTIVIIGDPDPDRFRRNNNRDNRGGGGQNGNHGGGGQNNNRDNRGGGGGRRDNGGNSYLERAANPNANNGANNGANNANPNNANPNNANPTNANNGTHNGPRKSKSFRQEGSEGFFNHPMDYHYDSGLYVNGQIRDCYDRE
jgi:hypothetical protein